MWFTGRQGMEYGRLATKEIKVKVLHAPSSIQAHLVLRVQQLGYLRPIPITDLPPYHKPSSLSFCPLDFFALAIAFVPAEWLKV